MGLTSGRGELGAEGPVTDSDSNCVSRPLDLRRQPLGRSSFGESSEHLQVLEWPGRSRESRSHGHQPEPGFLISTGTKALGQRGQDSQRNLPIQEAATWKEPVASENLERNQCPIQCSLDGSLWSTRHRKAVSRASVKSTPWDFQYTT